MKKKREKMKGKVKEKMKRDRDEGKDCFFFSKKFQDPPTRQMNQPKCFEKKNPRRTNYSSIFSPKIQNLAVFSIIYMIRIRFFGSGELIQNGFRRAR